MKNDTSVQNDLSIVLFEDPTLGGTMNRSSTGNELNKTFPSKSQYIHLHESKVTETINRVPDATFDRGSRSSSSDHDKNEMLAQDLRFLGPDKAGIFGTGHEISDAETVLSHEDDSICYAEDFESIDDNGNSADPDDAPGDIILEHDLVDVAQMGREKLKKAFLIGKLNLTQGNVILKTLRDNPFCLVNNVKLPLKIKMLDRRL